MKIIGMIPARGGSSRFHMKPLALICGKPMLYWVWKHSMEVACFDEVYVATDNEQIQKAAEDFGARVIMTSPDCETATERLWEVSRTVAADLYVMVNGDEPLVQAADIVQCIPERIPDDGFYVSNLMTDFSNPVEVVDPTNLKIVTNKDGVCLFISRAPIPFPKGAMDYAYQKFVGVGAFTPAALEYYHSTPRGPVEKIEENDSFRFIENRKDCYYINAHCKTLSVDTPKDRAAVEAYMKEQGVGLMFTLFAGPCVIESEEQVLGIAAEMQHMTQRLGIPYVFKASFDKANRTSIQSYRGPGLERGLEILQRVKDTLGLPVLTDLHEPWQAKPVAQVADVLQIPAFSLKQTDLLVAAAGTGRAVNVKKAQFLAPWDMANVVRKLEESGCRDILLCERGSCFGYNQLVVDMTGIVEMKKLGYPVVFDATHSVQKPGGNGSSTGGNRAYVEPLAKAALAAGADHLFMEVHPDPENALSDGPNMVPLQELPALLERLIRVYHAVH